MGHELDAMTHHEWRLLPGLSLLPDGAGRAAFVALHVPIVAALIWFGIGGGRRFHMLFGGFCAIHAVVHWALSAHPLYTFAPPLSDAMIYGAGIAGAVLAIAAVRSRA
jgi:uncharacterized membrane protein YedE/YeeE